MNVFLVFGLLFGIAYAVTLDELYDRICQVTEALQDQQFYISEMLRNNEESGIKEVRSTGVGSQAFRTASYGSGSIFAIKENPDYRLTNGQGELEAVLNGYQFSTGFLDYRIQQPSTDSSVLAAREDVVLPAVPPAVLNQPTVEDQIAEMQQWFQDFKNQDHSVRDYREYFKPVVCYLEGAWLEAECNVQNYFTSSRHGLDTSQTYDQLQNQFHFTQGSGRQDPSGNTARLPSTVYSKIGAFPERGQWMYRVLCQPLADDLPTNRFRAVDDFAIRVRHNLTLEQLTSTRLARFQLNPVDSDTWVDGVEKSEGLLDEIMGQVPGLNNHNGSSALRDEAFGEIATRTDGSDLLAGYYHRWLRTPTANLQNRHNMLRGRTSKNVFFALNTQPKVVESRIEYERTLYRQKWSYCIPLEIMYLTPLDNWNPYDIDLNDEATVVSGGRDGSSGNAYNGASENKYFRTPASFFNSLHYDEQPEDTPCSNKYVLDSSQVEREVSASGSRIFVDVAGGVRLQYPMAPVSVEGSATYKELAVVKDMVFHPEDNNELFHQLNQVDPDFTGAESYTVRLSDGGSTHTHDVIVRRAHINWASEGNTFIATSEITDADHPEYNIYGNHRHDVEMSFTATMYGQPNFDLEYLDGNITGYPHAGPVTIL